MSRLIAGASCCKVRLGWDWGACDHRHLALVDFLDIYRPVCASSPGGERVYVMHGSHAEKLQQHGPSCFLQTRSDASRLMAHVGMFGGVPAQLPYRRFRVGTSVPATSAGGQGCRVSMGAIFTCRDSSGGAPGHLIHRVSIINLQRPDQY